MPIFKINGQLLYFAHVPKCAGTSFTFYLTERFGAPAFEDRFFYKKPAPFPWTQTSPQHITTPALDRLFPEGFFDVTFGFVRHPEKRLESVFQFQKHHMKKIPRYVSYSRWLRGLSGKLDRSPSIYDHHIRPQTEFLPKGATVFKLEEGFVPAIHFLDTHFGPSDKQITVGHEKKSGKRVTSGARDKALIRELYAADFEAFDY